MSVSKGKYRLSNMVLDFVSLVPAGDDPLAKVVLSKADPDLTKLNSPDSQEDHMGEKIAKDDLDPEVVAYIDGLETEVEDLTKSVEEKDESITTLTTERDEAVKKAAEAESGVVVKSEDDQRKELLAKADPAVRALIEKAEADAKEASEIAKAERDARLEREFIAKAETLPMINTDKAALGGLLRRIGDALSPEDSAEVHKMLVAANEQIKKGNLFTEMGRGGAETTVSKSVDAAAREIMKTDSTLTFEQAQAKAYQQNPALFAEAMTGEGN